MQEPGGLQSMELQRVRYDLATKRQGRRGHQGVVNGRRSIHQINCFTMSYIMFSNIYSYLFKVPGTLLLHQPPLVETLE